jgi:hypothetical protein
VIAGKSDPASRVAGAGRAAIAAGRSYENPDDTAWSALCTLGCTDRMGKHDNTAINALVHHAAGGRRPASDPGANLFTTHRPAMLPARPAMLPARPLEVDRDSMPTFARGVSAAAMRTNPRAAHGVSNRPALSIASVASDLAYPEADRRRGTPARPAQLRAPMNAGAYQALPTTPRESADSLPTMALAPAQVYRRALPYAATEQVQNLSSARGYVPPAAQVPQPDAPVLPRNRAPAATPSMFPSDPASAYRGEGMVPTAQMYAHARPAPGPRSFLVELAYTLKEFALPIGVLMVLAVACGVYLASGRGGKKAAPVTSVAAAAPTPAPTPAPRSSLSSAVLAADPSLAPAEKVAPVVVQPVVVQPVVAQPVVDEAPVADAAPVAEIEMTPAKATHSKKRSARSHREHARPTRVAVADVPVKKAKRASSVDEAELPPNVADKTHGGPGKLVITSNKPALIYLDGRATGLTAPKKFTVPAGAHKVTLLDPETRKAKTGDVEIVAGKVATLDKQFK